MPTVQAKECFLAPLEPAIVGREREVNPMAKKSKKSKKDKKGKKK